MTARSAIIWGMLHLDYSSGLIPWDDLQGQDLTEYTCTDGSGRIVKITPKYPASHESWETIQADPGYFYNLGFIVRYPEEVEVSTSMHPDAVRHRQDGQVLIYSQKGYIMSIDAPSSPQYPTDKTEVVVKYTDSGNYSLTNIVHRTWS